MKIALLHDSVLPPKTYGGIERIVVSLAYEYRRLGHDVTVICRQGSNLADFETIELKPGYQLQSPAQWLPSDIEFLHSHQPLTVSPDLKPNIPFLVTIHGNGRRDEKYWPNTNFLSQSHASHHAARYFVYNGVDPAHYPFVADKQDYYVFLARASWRVKNLKTVIAWAQDLGVRLEIMGGSGISRGQIHYNGMADEKMKADLLPYARALLYPTNWDEPCAVAPLEALACGTPVISSQNGCMPELVRPGTGVVCSSYDQLLAAPAQLQDVTPRACREAVETFFSVGRMAQDYLALIEKIRTLGELDHSPRYAFDRGSVKPIFKPTLANRLRLMVTGKI